MSETCMNGPEGVQVISWLSFCFRALRACELHDNVEGYVSKHPMHGMQPSAFVSAVKSVLALSHRNPSGLRKTPTCLVYKYALCNVSYLRQLSPPNMNRECFAQRLHKPD